ncbi:MAG: U32 family peptidase C-terminal domain-containing protein [Patescibacteria group bacterium]|nr:U32 family peptidase C-terminal domain-containing protein [Patescibacteria group bacterium]
MTLNIYAHQRHLKTLPKHLKLIKEIQPSAVIVSDPGVLSVIRRKLPNQEVHLSTQANATNSEAIKFWQQQGVSRVILAREVTLEEIQEIKKKTPNVELECFVHGAMCMSYSGRCILSKWMTNRSANMGDCSQPCRWQYSVVDDKKRFSVELEQDQHGTYFFNSYDMCMVEHLDELIDTGIDSLKIEGRAKSVYYVAMVTRAYRIVLDATWKARKDRLKESELERVIPEQRKQLEKLSHRGYSEGFFFGEEPQHLFDKAYKETNWLFVGISQEEKKSKERNIFVHNYLNKGDEVEVVGATFDCMVKIERIVDEKGEEIKSAHGGLNKTFQVTLSKSVEGTFLARRNEKNIG